MGPEAGPGRALLEVEDLTVSFATADGVVQAVRGVSFALERGKTLGIVGESGSGKSVTMQAIMGLNQGAQIGGHVLFEGEDILSMSPERLRAVRGRRIAMVFQDPLSSLHPYYRVGWQLVEMIRAHEKIPKAQARGRAIELLGLVGIPQAERRVDSFPHEFSGGMRQRVMIAMALALDPAVLIADEPTTALDVTVQAQVLELMMRLQTELGMAIILITHDLGVVAGMADEVMIMYGGKAAERANRQDTYYRPHHPYTVGLLESIPQVGMEEKSLQPIPGQPPSLISPPSGCVFHTRCRFAFGRCSMAEPALQPVQPASTHLSACWLPGALVGLGADVDAQREQAKAVSPPPQADSEALEAGRSGPDTSATGGAGVGGRE
ncbi:MAG: ABC transporter ATP-binding protein [Acidimicrobiales bacterium]